MSRQTPHAGPIKGGEGTACFHARHANLFRPERLYRVYVKPGRLYFIFVGGSRPSDLSGFPLKGILGLALHVVAGSVAEAKAAALLLRQRQRLAAMEGASPEQLLPGDKHNFVVDVGDVVQSRVSGQSILISKGPHAGKWLLKTRSGPRRVFQFDSEDEMRVAIDSLPLALGNRTQSTITWSTTRFRFVKQR